MATTGPLGDGDYSVRFMRRPTLTQAASTIGELEATSGTWNRQLVTTTDASATFAVGDDGAPDWARVLNDVVSVGPWRTEMEIWRDPGDLCWVGPMLDLVTTGDDDLVTVTARDMSAWWAVRGLFQTIVHKDVELATIFAEYLAIAFDSDNPRITVVTTPTGIKGSRTVAASDLKMLSDVLPELVRSGVDWTVTNREFWVGGLTISQTDRLPGRLVDEHFVGSPQTHLSGSGMVNDARVRANKITGHFGGPDDDGVLLQGVQDESTIEDQASADWSAETWWDRVHDPLAYIDGDNQLAPGAPVSVEALVPGLTAFLDVEGAGVFPVRNLLRLERVAGSWNADGDAISVTFQPPGTEADTVGGG